MRFVYPLALVAVLACQGQILQPIAANSATVSGAIPPTVTANTITGSSAGTTALVVTLPSTPNSGECVLLSFRQRITSGTWGNLTSVASTNTTWVSAGFTGTGGTTSGLGLWIGKVAASAGAAITVTASNGGNSAALVVNATVATGIPACDATSVDVALVGLSGTSTAPAIGSYTTGHANDLLYIAGSTTTLACTGWTGQPAGYTTLTCKDFTGPADGMQPNYLILSSAGAQTATWTISSSVFWRTLVVGLKGNN